MNAMKPVLLAALTLLAPASLATETLYFNFAHVDVDERRIAPDAWLTVDRGRINRIGTGRPPEDHAGPRIDMGGAWAIPGLIDGHAHLTSGPHSLSVVDGEPLVTIESVDSITRYNALMALAFGVTTVRNPGSDPEASRRYDENVASGRWMGPAAIHAGAVAQPLPFGGNAFVHPKTPAEWDAEAARQAGLGMRYFKLYVSLSPEELALGIEAAHANGLEAIAHLDAVSWQTALELGIDGLEHALPTSGDLLPPADREYFEARRQSGSQYLYEWFLLVDFDGPEMRRLFDTLSERQTTLNMTLLVNEMLTHADDLSAIIDERTASYLHPEVWRAATQFLAAGAAAWTSEDFAAARAALPKVREFARRVFAAQIPLLIGTDGNGGGPLMALEMQLHEAAGIDAWDVLDLATRRAAAILDLDTTGRLAPGYEADVVFLRANPIEDLAAIASVDAVIVDGSLHAHEDLVGRAQAFLEGDNGH